MVLRKPLTWFLAALCVYFLYFFHLTAAGMLGPDEPRYAAIGREMARSGDWITPRLWGQPWFEKPALLYWMTGAACRLGLGDDLAPRLPVALLSVAFLGLYFWTMRREFGGRAACFATLILATSAGWVGLSQAGVPDIPMAAAFSAAVLLSLPWARTGDRGQLPYASAALGLAVLAKGLVPLLLILPLLWTARRRWPDLLQPLVWGPFLVVVAPWYVACFVRNGMPFLDQLFWQHHLQRFFSASLQHSQPWWFYFPILLAGVFPWTPLVPVIFRAKVRQSGSALLLVVIFGLLFFSLSLNKLPEYLLPLVPSLAALMGIGLADIRERAATWLLAASAALAGLAPLLADILPQALAAGISKSHVPSMNWIFALQVSIVLLVAFLRPSRGILVVSAAVCAVVIFLKIVSLPAIDQAASARPLWRQIAGRRDQVCIESMHRSWRYGLNYYSVVPLPDCGVMERPMHVVQVDGEPPEVRAPRAAVY
jgi:4-amino-4-deoxy-L-arabinose transferase-like glycosyltransferase